jgi:tetratricopeptide (TPR) repeat protein
LDYWPLRRLKFRQERSRNEILEKTTAKRSEVLRLVFEKVPLFLLTMGSSILTFLLVKREFGVYSFDLLSLQARLTNAMVSYLEYLRKMLWPEKLAIFYPHPGNTLPAWQGILCGMVLVGITVVSIKLIRKAPYVAVGWFWYLGTLLPVIGIVQVGGVAMADRYAYIPLIGIFIIIAWGIPELIARWRYKEKVLSVSAGIIIFALLITTWKQVSHWKSSITIFKHAIRVTDKKHPSFSVVYNNLGIALYAKGKNQEAIYHYQMAIKTNPAHAEAYYNLAIGLNAEKKKEEAIPYYKMAIRLNPNYTNAHYNLGIILIQKGVLKEAVHHFRETVRLRPDLVKAQDYLKFALLQSQGLK